MIYAVFLCDKNWIIKKIKEHRADFFIQEGKCLSEFLVNSDQLKREEDKHYAIVLHFSGMEKAVPAFIRTFAEGALVILSHLENDAEATELYNHYDEYVEWAKDHIQGLYHNEFYLIQQMNNQLIDSQRALACSNMRLQQAVGEIQATNEKLEVAKQTAERAMQVAEKASKSKTEFLASMSHDIRTPMNAIYGISNLMQHELQNPDKMLDYIEKLQTSSKHLLGIINDILDVSKIENNSMELRKEEVDLEEQLEQIETVIRQQATEHEQNFDMVLEVEHWHFFGDAARLRQVLINLLSNAVKYTPNGGSISFCVQELSNDGNTEYVIYCFTVKDTGVGMSPEFMEHIFEPFARSRKSIESEIQGAGLGMAITKNIVEMMGGSIKVDSVVGEGSCFEVKLSFKRNQKADITERKAGGVLNKEHMNRVLDGKRFLCAEDNALNAQILEAILELAGAECTIYADGKQLIDAFAKIKPGEYDAILMDVQMPVMNGYEATRYIRENGNSLGKTIPIIAMTANAFSEDVRHSMEAGMDAHVSKPIDLKILEKEIYKLFNRER